MSRATLDLNLREDVAAIGEVDPEAEVIVEEAEGETCVEVAVVLIVLDPETDHQTLSPTITTTLIIQIRAIREHSPQRRRIQPGCLLLRLHHRQCNSNTINMHSHNNNSSQIRNSTTYKTRLLHTSSSSSKALHGININNRNSSSSRLTVVKHNNFTNLEQLKVQRMASPQELSSTLHSSKDSNKRSSSRSSHQSIPQPRTDKPVHKVATMLNRRRSSS